MKVFGGDKSHNGCSAGMFPKTLVSKSVMSGFVDAGRQQRDALASGFRTQHTPESPCTSFVKSIAWQVDGGTRSEQEFRRPEETSQGCGNERCGTRPVPAECEIDSCANNLFWESEVMANQFHRSMQRPRHAPAMDRAQVTAGRTHPAGGTPRVHRDECGLPQESNGLVAAKDVSDSNQWWERAAWPALCWTPEDHAEEVLLQGNPKCHQIPGCPAALKESLQARKEEQAPPLKKSSFWGEGCSLARRRTESLRTCKVSRPQAATGAREAARLHRKSKSARSSALRGRQVLEPLAVHSLPRALSGRAA